MTGRSVRRPGGPGVPPRPAPKPKQSRSPTKRSGRALRKESLVQNIPIQLERTYRELRTDKVKRIAASLAEGKEPDRWLLDAYLITLAVEEYTDLMAGEPA
jgi:hypothetical protein